MKRSRLLMLALACLPVLIAFYFWRISHLSFIGQPKPAETIADNGNPDIYMQKTATQTFNAEGQLSVTIFSQSLEASGKDNQVQLNAPLITMAEVNQQNWRASSQKGFYENGSALIKLEGDVLIWDDNERRPLEIRTEQMVYQPSEQLVTTQSPVEIVSPGHRITAKGMQADLSHRKISLLSEVKAIHAPF